MISQKEIERLFDSLGDKPKALRYGAGEFRWWPVARKLQSDNVVGVYDAGVTYQQFIEDIRWAEREMK